MVNIYESREAAYAAIPKIIAQVAERFPGPKEILLAAFHGHSGRRLTYEAPSIPEFEEFDNALLSCARSSGADMWVFREMYNITTPPRLEQIIKRIERAGDA